jgi:hypothetical protein
MHQPMKQIENEAAFKPDQARVICTFVARFKKNARQVQRPPSRLPGKAEILKRFVGRSRA